MIVVSDTSAINNLAAIDQLILLKQLYGTVIIPEAVYGELVVPPISAGGEEAKSYDWIQVRHVSDRAIVDEFLTELDLGESEAIALALEIGADQILLDERKAREFAKTKGLTLTGVLGLLIVAKTKDLIPAVRPLIIALRQQADFWLSEALCNRALQTVGEKPL